MLAKTYTLGLIGLDAHPVDIEIDVANGLPQTTIVGLPDSAIKESKERVRSGIKNSGFRYPADKITVSLAPADIKKEGALYDLPIAMGILAASKQIQPTLLEEYWFAAELALDGRLRPVKGILAMAQALATHRIKKLVLPVANAPEAALVEGIQVFGFKTLRDLIEGLHNPETLKPYSNSAASTSATDDGDEPDFADVKGQFLAKRAMEIAAAGGHNILLVGPPGSGKTMLARRLPGILPEMTAHESLETTKIHSVAGYTHAGSRLLRQRPFRAPHHTISDVALAGGGSNPQPGEISLAHNGVLFLDELPEFHRNALEILRQPLEEGCIRIARAQKSLSFPARFMLVAAMNPCPCGYYTDPSHPCRCSQNKIHQYLGKVSGPLLDRIDIHIEVPAIKYMELSDNTPAESSAQIKKRVNKARDLQEARFSSEGSAANKGRISFNAQMSHRQTRKYCVLGKEENNLLRTAMDSFRLSARAFDKILKISRTIADLAGCETIGTPHLAEAINYRSLDRGFFV